MFGDASLRRSLVMLALLLGLGVAAVAFACAPAIATVHERRVEGELRRQVQAAAQLARPGVAALLSGVGRAEAARPLSELASASGVRVSVFAPDGALLFDSGGHGAAADRPEVVAAAGGGDGASRRADAATGVDTRFVAMLARAPGGSGAVIVRVAQPAAAADGPLREELRMFALAALAAWVLGLLLGGAFLARQHAGAAALRLALNEPKAVYPRGETGVIGDIARRVEALLEENRALRKDRSAERGEAEAILASMSEAVLAVDAESRLRVVNGAASRLLGLDSQAAVGQPIGGVVRGEGIADAAVRAAAGEDARARVELPGPPARILEVAARPIRPQGGAVVVLRDVTEAARFAEMRRDFVAAASHELRTPLSVASGMVETVLDGVLEDRAKAREFLEAADRHLKTLIAIVNDLLDLGKLESRPEFAPRAVAIAEVLEMAVEAHRAAAKAKEQDLTLEVPDSLPPLMADAPLLERAFSNLVENAVRYTPRGGAIAVRAEAEPGAVRVAVSDTGIGIPEKDLKRIFERFYRVDKSRSRETGSTGLGLAIVKHIVALHKGEVWAESGAGRGATFVVRLPGF